LNGDQGGGARRNYWKLVFCCCILSPTPFGFALLKSPAGFAEISGWFAEISG
jgi:hypothetical protein